VLVRSAGYQTQQEFPQHYPKRGNIESTFSMLKRKFDDSLRSKTDTAMVSELLCNVLCHNLVVLIHEMHELVLSPYSGNPQLLNSRSGGLGVSF
jgi:hypothetical protein